MSLNAVPVDVRPEILKYLDDRSLSCLKSISRGWNDSVTDLFNSRIEELRNCTSHMDGLWFNWMRERPFEAIPPTPTPAYYMRRQHRMAKELISSPCGISTIDRMLESYNNESKQSIVRITSLFAAHVKPMPFNANNIEMDRINLSRILIGLCEKSLKRSEQGDSNEFQLFQNSITIAETKGLLPYLYCEITSCLSLAVDIKYHRALLEACARSSPAAFKQHLTDLMMRSRTTEILGLETLQIACKYNQIATTDDFAILLDVASIGIKKCISFLLSKARELKMALPAEGLCQAALYAQQRGHNGVVIALIDEIRNCRYKFDPKILWKIFETSLQGFSIVNGAISGDSERIQDVEHIRQIVEEMNRNTFPFKANNIWKAIQIALDPQQPNIAVIQMLVDMAREKGISLKDVQPESWKTKIIKKAEEAGISLSLDSGVVRKLEESE